MESLSFIQNKKIKKLTTHACIRTGKIECIEKIDVITKIYSNSGFTLCMYNGDNTLNMLADHIGRGNINIVGREDHVGAIELNFFRGKSSSGTVSRV